jgi:hypothetical protein
VRIGGKALALVAAAVVLLAVAAHGAFAQASAAAPTTAPPTTAEVPAQPPAASLIITGKEASTWADRGGSGASIVQVAGPLSIQIDKTTLTARDAVVWIEAVRGERGGAAAARPGDEQVTVALLGEATVQRPEMTRSGDRLLVTARVNGPIRIAADDRQPRDLSASATFKAAVTLREQSEAAGAAQQHQAVDLPTTPAPGAAAPTPRAVTTRPTIPGAAGVTTRPSAAPVIYRAADISNLTAGNGKMALALGGRDGVVLSREGDDGTVLEMQAQRAVVFTTLTGLRDMTDMRNVRRVEEAITAAYLEGDVRVTITSPNDQSSEQRLEANRVYYDFTTDRAVLTEAVLHTVDVARNIPLIVRAETIRQLSDREYRATGTELSTSSFAVPSYSVRADRAYVRQVDTGDARYGTRTYFQADDVTLRSFGVPFFYLPRVGGNVTERGGALRELSFGQSENFGTSIETRWGFFETIGRIPPEQLDLTYKLDYYSERGPAAGVDAEYAGGFVSRTTKQAWNFEGDFRSYFVLNDSGVDDLGRHRALVDPDEDFRGRVRWEHQHFFPENWQLQVRSGWVSDATFMEEWFEDEFDEELPLESSLYLKRQENSEALTFLATVQPNDLVTSAEYQQEQFEIERLPEFGYHRIGESFADDRLTFYSDNTFGRYRFNPSDSDLGEQGFRFGNNVRPGRPSLGVTGVDGLSGPPPVDDDWTFRGDFRQEVGYPLAVGQFKVVPYVMGRYTGYTDSPDGSNQNRGLAGAGVRVNTQFWQINNRARSELFDINRTRHIIEPEVHAFTSAANVDPNELWIYDEQVDNVHDISAVQFALRQRWQTKRGGPGRQRSVDFLKFNVEANFFGNQPSDPELAPLGFRGLFYPSLPEASIPRNSINADTQWRVSDTTIILGDAQYNLDESTLATASIGVVARRDARVAYFAGLRYIEELDSNIGTIAFSYELTTRYTVGLRQSYDFGDSGSVYSSISLQRRFDRFLMLVSAYNNSTDDNKGFSFGFFPEGFAGATTDTLQRSFGSR